MLVCFLPKIARRIFKFKIMISSIFLRFIRFLIISFLCSTPILALPETWKVNVILSLSFGLFAILMFLDSLLFLSIYNKHSDFFVGEFLPYISFIVVSLGVFYLIPGNTYYNFLFLPLRFAECFNTETIVSMCTVYVIIFVLILVSFSFAGLIRKKLSKNHKQSYENHSLLI